MGVMGRHLAGALAVVLVGGALVPAAAGAQSGTNPLIPQSPTNPLSPTLPLSAPTTTTTSTPVITGTNTNSANGGLQGSGIVAIAIGAIVVLGGIGYFIWRDARRRAPIRGHAHAAAEFGSRRTGSKAPPKPRKLSPAEKRRRKRGRAR
jgi:hypothetical protein